MNNEIKDQWLKALRSGEYMQGRETLHRLYEMGGPATGVFCCLGVLTDLAVKQGVIPEPAQSEFGSFDYGSEQTCSFLPLEVIDWAGLSEQNPYVDYEDGLIPLSELNDDRELNFSELADLIEEQL